MKTPEEIAAEARRRYFATVGAPVDSKIDAMILDAIDADRAQRADDDAALADPWLSTLRVIEGDGEEYTDAVRITFTRDWDESLTRTHTVSWETFVKVLAIVAREEDAQK